VPHALGTPPRLNRPQGREVLRRSMKDPAPRARGTPIWSDWRRPRGAIRMAPGASASRRGDVAAAFGMPRRDRARRSSVTTSCHRLAEDREERVSKRPDWEIDPCSRPLNAHNRADGIARCRLPRCSSTPGSPCDGRRGGDRTGQGAACEPSIAGLQDRFRFVSS
jgi:hypothetical protein